MALLTDTESRTVATKLSVFLLLFYSCYYTISVIMVAGFQTTWADSNGLETYPFLHSKDMFNPAGSSDALGRWLAMVSNYLLALIVNFVYLKSSKLTWDYALSTSIVHFVLSCLVTMAFPTNWIWWLTVILATVALWIIGELTVYRFIDLREISVDNA